MKQSSRSKWSATNEALKIVSGILLIATILTCLTITFSGCSGGNDSEEEVGTLKITGVSIPSSVDIVANGDITITGKGFVANDQIKLTLSTDATKTYVITVKSATDASATYTLPSGINSGIYAITVIRGTQSLSLGSFTINIIANTSIPDIAGMSVKGIVYSNGKGISGVVVSDGYLVTTTNSEGIYYLASQKKSGYVFISVPGNYEVASTSNAPQFFKRLSASASTIEQKDFALTPADNSKHVVLAMTDWHLANRNDDLAQFTNTILPDVNSTINTYKASGSKVYILTLGDMTWDAYWYENNYGLTDYLTQMSKLNCSVFNTMGNHDNDPYCAGDWLAEAKFKTVIGPTYYSFNLGNVHYVVLDDIEYLNANGVQGSIGTRDYNDVIVSDQMEWLKKDLATITDKTTPIVVGMHIQIHQNPKIDTNGNTVNTISLNNGTTFMNCFQGFPNVHILTGHTHINYNIVTASGTMMEHNTAAICSTWWWTGKNGYAGNQTCKDGSPGGYGVYETSGKDIKWYYKSAGYAKNYQFRSYDLNKVYITAAAYAPASTDAALSPYVSTYGAPSTKNEVLINVWDYDPSWKVEVKEAGKSLTVTRVAAYDPLHIISYEAKRLNVGAVPTDDFVTLSTTHMFKVTASSASSTLDITVTDRFGNVYTETMTRPKEFTCSSK